MASAGTSKSAQPGAARALPEGYYLDNLEAVVDTVLERYGDLLTAAEQDFVADFRALPLACRRLWVRLVSRRGPCLRRDALSYPEIPHLDRALTELEQRGFADRAGDEPAANLLPLLRAAELAALEADLLGTSPPQRKAQRIARLLAETEAATLRAALERRLRAVRPLRRDALLTFRLLFFGNLHQDWSAFVTRDLGVVRYEPYPLERRLRRFPSRRAVDDALALARCTREVQQRLAAGGLEQAVELASPLLAREDGWHPAVRRRLDRLANLLGAALERAGRRDEALTVYRLAWSPPARERCVRLLARQGAIGRALRLCREIENEPRDESERLFAPRFANRLRRKCGDRVPPLPRRRRPSLELTLSHRDGTAVEALALEHFEHRGRRGVFAENWLWKSLFGLAFWDVIFAPVPGAFEHPFQLGPGDLFEPTFRQARQRRIERRLEWLRRTPELSSTLLARFDAKRGVANHLVSWHPGARRALALVLERLRGEHLAPVADRLARDLRRYRRGLPDLFVVAGEDPGFVLYEVKAPGDQLRPEQKGWLDYLNDRGLPARILNVRWRSP
ncbi:MAG: VRR-NUC domain-containing protein [Acidobacteria bacterium]|nr:MAG: VRR-NUC domain-containing protein [Acidobacteriota bacterium]